MPDLEAKTQETARRFWEAAGRPEGRDLEIWCMAELWVTQEAACRARLAPRFLTFPRNHGASKDDAAGA